MRTTPYRRLALAGVMLAAACSFRPAPISVSENMVIVENQSRRDWRNVVVTVNDHFRGGAAALLAGGRLTAPLSQFQTGFGQRFDISRQHVFKVEVVATDSSGEPVTLRFESRSGKR